MDTVRTGFCDLRGINVSRVLVDFGYDSVLKCESCGLMVESQVFDVDREELYKRYSDGTNLKGGLRLTAILGSEK